MSSRRQSAPAWRLGAALLLVSGSIASAGTTPPDDQPAISIAITSPLGRTGLPGTVRIVARVRVGDGAQAPAAVRFYVNGTLIATDTDGPPYVAEWQDENPFEACTLAVEADAAVGSPGARYGGARAAHDCGIHRHHQRRCRRGGAGRQWTLCRRPRRLAVRPSRGRRGAGDRRGDVGGSRRHLHAPDRQQPEHVGQRPVRAARGGQARRLPEGRRPDRRRSLPAGITSSPDRPTTRRPSPTLSGPSRRRAARPSSTPCSRLPSVSATTRDDGWWC